MILLVIYVPGLAKAFVTYALPLEDWIIVIVMAFTIMPVLEVAKWMLRRGWFGKIE
jgi:Ca2+-transporting ATPase